MAQLETRLWFFYTGTTYILQGLEALHCGQIMLMSRNDKGMVQTFDTFAKLRDFAAGNARRGFVLLNAHLYKDPFVHVNNTDTLVFDFHAFPSRPQPHPVQYAGRWHGTSSCMGLTFMLDRVECRHMSCHRITAAQKWPYYHNACGATIGQTALPKN